MALQILLMETNNMKKFLAIFIVMLLVSSQAFAALVPTVTSRQRYEDSNGTTYERVLGTLAFDSTYPCNTSTGICGEPLPSTKLGLSSVKRMAIDPAMSTVAGGVLIMKYHSAGLSGVGGDTAADQPNVRAYYTGLPSATNTTAAALVSAASYDLSLLTAVPFEAVGTVL